MKREKKPNDHKADLSQNSDTKSPKKTTTGNEARELSDSDIENVTGGCFIRLPWIDR